MTDEQKIETEGTTEEQGIGRRQLLTRAGIGAASLAVASSGLLSSRVALASSGKQRTPGIRPKIAARIGRNPRYYGQWNKVTGQRPFGGFNMAVGYVAEGVDGNDPDQVGLNPSGLFETILPECPSAVGGNETPARSAEYWFKDILGYDNEMMAIELWTAINYFRRFGAVDLDDPDSPDWPGHPDPENEKSLFGPRVAVGYKGRGYARQAPTLLAPTVAYTIVFKAGTAHPNYTGGTTASHPEDNGKVRDGGVWGGVVEDMDVLGIMQEVKRGERKYSQPIWKRRKNGTYKVMGAKMDYPPYGYAEWGQWFWRAYRATGIMDPMKIDPDSDPRSRKANRPDWPVGFLSRGTDFFWGSYNWCFGQKEPTQTVHYQSEVPTRFRDFDGIPEAFICELTEHPASDKVPANQVQQGFKDVTGRLGGFQDANDKRFRNQQPFGLGRVHGTSYPRGITADGRATFHLRNWLLWPPRLNTIVTINNSVPGLGILGSI